jgi:hypothetical protein|tara:strand:- start:126 stop:1073 length:948 start_codon:yes stop_codon:yes gene_type:complete
MFCGFIPYLTFGRAKGLLVFDPRVSDIPFIKVIGQHGAGDWATALILAHKCSSAIKSQVELKFFWPDDIKFEKEIGYLSDTLYKSEDVIVTHEIGDKRVKLFHKFDGDYSSSSWCPSIASQERHTILSNKLETWLNEYAYGVIGFTSPDGKLNDNNWIMKEEYLNRPVENKVVVWDSRDNKSVQSVVKKRDVLSPEAWDELYKKFEDRGYEVVRINYETPIDEVIDHVSTCRFTASYHGMWHYIPKLLYKPMVVITDHRHSINDIDSPPEAWILNSTNYYNLINLNLDEVISIQEGRLDDKFKTFMEKHNETTPT